ncbi:MAG: N-acetylmuramoyl-L-alanine amidase [Bacteroidetes bacterium]|nr:N-acetylmuramoyl-L-alanine amidase [Bacteroidota bacterium]
MLRGQQVVSRQLPVTAERACFLETENPFGALVIRARPDIVASLVVSAGGNAFVPGVDEDSQVTNGLATTNLMVFDRPVNQATITGVVPGNEIEAITINLPQISLPEQAKTDPAGCEMPPLVSQQSWREGLPAPDYERVFNTVNNVILHHSATSNTVTDYTNLVRSIYTYHTQVNGWSDIGYNYLIAPDGIIYAGRDPGLLMANDEVMGAHFCASNSGTLGICLLGTYTSVQPSEAAIISLEQLLSWKMAKDSLPPFGTYAHPLNQLLGVVAGHRDGCATTCPGDGVYQLLQAVREGSNALLESCGIYLDLVEDPQQHHQTLVFPNPASSREFYLSDLGFVPQQLRLVTTGGRMLAVGVISVAGNRMRLSAVAAPGVYVLEAIGDRRVFRTKLIMQ